MKDKIVSWLNSEAYKTLTESFGGMMLAMFLIQVSFLGVAFSVGTPLLIVQTILLFLIFLVFILFKDGAKEAHVKMGFFFLKVAPLIYMMGLLYGMLRAGAKRMEDPELQSSMTVLLLILSVALILGYVILMTQQTVVEAMNAIKESTALSMLIGKQVTINPGDAVIGKEIEISYKENGDKIYKETDNPLVLPVKDRYLHMLILGPTGSGKTSQVLIPMINKDIQNLDLGIIVMEPKGDLAEKVFAMARHYDREVQYFNPILPDCPYFNPLFGKEEDVIENMATTFKMLDDSSSTFFQNMSENVIRNALKVLKRLYGNDANMLDLYTLIHNNESKGKKIIQEFSKLEVATAELQKENDDIVAWFLGDYFTGSNAGDNRGATKTYEHCSGIRSQVAKLVSNKYLRRVLNPPKGHGSDIDFDDALERGTVIAIATAQGKLRDLGRFLGYFLILQLQSSVFKRPGNENTRRGCMLYIDEFQVYSNPGFADMLTQGRSYRVASHLATQGRDQIGMGSGKEGEAFIQLVSSNARNLIIYPGVNHKDAKFYSDYFGEEMKKTKQVGISRQRLGMGNITKFRLTNESIREDEKAAARFSPSDIIYRPFGEITYLLIKNNSIQPAGVAKIEYIPMELNNLLDTMVAEYNEEQDEKHKRAFGGKMTENIEEELIRPPSQSSGFKPAYHTLPVENAETEEDTFLVDDYDEEEDSLFASVRSNLVSDDDDEDDIF